MKLNVGLIGKGNWGTKIKEKLDNLANVKFISGRNQNFTNQINKKNIEWIFIATPNQTHYKIVKKCIMNSINVFCEKPLCLSYEKAKELILLARKKKVKLFISDIYNFYSSKIKKLNKVNYVSRSKYVGGNDCEFFFRLMYHDISILYKFLKNKTLNNYHISKDFNKKNFFLILKFQNNLVINFNYFLNSKKKVHKINGISIKSKKDYLKKMINDILKNNVNFNENNKKSLFIIKFINKLQKRN